MNFDKIRSCLIAELDHRKHQIEDGQYNWFSVKVFLRTRTGEPSATFQSEEACRLESKEEIRLFVNGNQNGQRRG
jgi:hypothetical protein